MREHYAEKLVFVVGASEGIGKALAKELVSLDSRVVITSRSTENLEKARRDISSTGDGKVLALSAFDITDWENTRSSIDALVKQYGTPDYLINCAGFAHPGYIETQDVGLFRQMMELNYFGTVHTCKAIVPHLLKRRQGTIVNVSSMAGFLGLFGYTGYCASKFAVTGFSEALRRELKPFGIHVAVLCPPNTRTPGLERENRVKPAEVLATEEKVKVVEPEFVAAYLLKKLYSKKSMIIPTFDGRLAYSLNRHIPSIIDVFVKRPAPKI